MQNLFHDGGFSSMGMSLRAMNQYAKDMAPYEDEKIKNCYIDALNNGVYEAANNLGILTYNVEHLDKP